MNDILNKTIVLVLNRNWQAINIRTPADAFCQMATNVATALEIEGENHIRPVKWEEWLTLPIRESDNAVHTVRGAIRQTSAGSYLALDPNVGKRLLDNIKRTVDDLSASAQRPVLLTSMDIRRYLRKMIEQDLYELPVLSYQELTQEINIQPLARVDL